MSESWRENWLRGQAERRRQAEQQRLCRIADASERLHDFVSALQLEHSLDDDALVGVLTLELEWFGGEVVYEIAQ